MHGTGYWREESYIYYGNARRVSWTIQKCKNIFWSDRSLKYFFAYIIWIMFCSYSLMICKILAFQQSRLAFSVMLFLCTFWKISYKTLQLATISATLFKFFYSNVQIKGMMKQVAGGLFEQIIWDSRGNQICHSLCCYAYVSIM